jgi:hypothetical protein
MATRTAKATTKVERTADAANTQLVDYGSIATQLVGYGTIAQMMARPFEIWLRWQADMLKAAEPVTTGWLERRRESTEAALEAIEKLAGCRDFSEVASIQSNWLDGAMKRLNSNRASDGHVAGGVHREPERDSNFIRGGYFTTASGG